MQLTIFPTVRGDVARPFETSWENLVEYVRNPPLVRAKHDCELIKLATFGEQRTPRGSLRHDGNVLSVAGIEADYDAGELSPETAAALLQLAGIRSVIYTSPSHTPNAPRWRVLAPLSRDYAPHERREFVGRLNGALGGVLAHESFTLSQTFFIGRVLGTPYETHVIDGTPVDLCNIAPIFPAAAPARIHDADAVADLSEIESALQFIPADDYHEWIAVGQALSQLGEDGFRLWSEWSARSDKHDPGNDLWRWETFSAERTGFQAIFAKAQRNGWENPKARKPVDLSVFAKPGVATTGPQPFNGGFVSLEDQSRMFAGCTYVRDCHKILIPGGDMLNKERFDVEFGGFAFTLDAANTKTTKSAWEAFTASQAIRFPRATTTCFRPEIAPGAVIEEAGQTLANVWWPIETRCEPGDISPFLHHLKLLLPVESDREIILCYMAAMVQYPGEKFQWCPLLQGAKGNGKTVIYTVMEAIIGQRYTHALNASDIAGNGGRFTGWLANKLFIGVEEIYTAHRREVLDILKPLITNRRVEIQAKGADQVTMDNRANFIMFTNHKDAIQVDVDERRYAIFYTAQQSAEDVQLVGMGGAYFPKLYTWLRTDGAAHIAHFLRSYVIPDELNPAKLLHRAPATSSFAEALDATRSPIEQEILEAVGLGLPGFAGGWISFSMLRKHIVYKVTLRQLHEIVQRLGYVTHPALGTHGRTDNMIHPDGCKSVLYLKQGHIALNETRRGEIARLYQSAQGALFGANQNEIKHHNS